MCKKRKNIPTASRGFDNWVEIFSKIFKMNQCTETNRPKLLWNQFIMPAMGTFCVFVYILAPLAKGYSNRKVARISSNFHCYVLRLYAKHWKNLLNFFTMKKVKKHSCWLCFFFLFSHISSVSFFNSTLSRGHISVGFKCLK